MALSIVPLTATSDIAQADVDTLSATVPAADRCDTEGRDWPIDVWQAYIADAQGTGKRVFVIRDEQGGIHGGIMLQRLSATEVRIRGLMLPFGPRLDEAITRMFVVLRARGFTTIWGNVYNDRNRRRLAQIDGVTMTGVRLDAT